MWAYIPQVTCPLFLSYLKKTKKKKEKSHGLELLSSQGWSLNFTKIQEHGKACSSCASCFFLKKWSPKDTAI